MRGYHLIPTQINEKSVGDEENIVQKEHSFRIKNIMRDIKANDFVE